MAGAAPSMQAEMTAAEAAHLMFLISVLSPRALGGRARELAPSGAVEAMSSRPPPPWGRYTDDCVIFASALRQRIFSFAHLCLPRRTPFLTLSARLMFGTPYSARKRRCPGGRQRGLNTLIKRA